MKKQNYWRSTFITFVCSMLHATCISFSLMKNNNQALINNQQISLTVNNLNTVLCSIEPWRVDGSNISDIILMCPVELLRQRPKNFVIWLVNKTQFELLHISNRRFETRNFKSQKWVSMFLSNLVENFFLVILKDRIFFWNFVRKILI
jgi:hypothetical protein